MLCLVLQSCLTLCDPMDCSLPGSSVHGDSPGKNTRVGCHFFLQGIYPTQESNPGLPHCRQILYHLSHLRVVICIVNLQEGDLICMASESPLTMESFLYEICYLTSVFCGILFEQCCTSREIRHITLQNYMVTTEDSFRVRHLWIVFWIYCSVNM